MRRFGFAISALISPATFAGRVPVSKLTLLKTTTKTV